MNSLTIAAFVLFGMAVTVESAVWMTCLHRLRTRHPQQWRHAAQPPLWQDRTLLSARSTMRYFLYFDYQSSLDADGIRFCTRNRTRMLGAYWLTAITGALLLVALGVRGL